MKRILLLFAFLRRYDVMIDYYYKCNNSCYNQSSIVVIILNYYIIDRIRRDIII